MSAIGTFFGVLFVLLFAVAVTSKGALKGPDAFALRWTVISLAVAISGGAAWLRWRMSQPDKGANRLSTHPPADARAEVAAASKHAIVFRRHFPPRPGTATLSFFGGAPIAPSGFTWPRPVGTGTQSRPFSFLLQIDCAAVPREGSRGLLPDRGVLYFFHDLTWGQPDAFRVLYADAQDNDRWTRVQPPGDLGLAFGDGAVRM